ncbi:hypothetical protein CHARACLAT_005726 [Characodon lateralis]|uniref:Uncharacterized protein n=1 Tax=Characodon lateralis TaxID=208331 RepID=A0ABU7CV36_9TELE|nr:hypothetical protein [Characodon lateralis]
MNVNANTISEDPAVPQNWHNSHDVVLDSFVTSWISRGSSVGVISSKFPGHLPGVRAPGAPLKGGVQGRPEQMPQPPQLTPFDVEEQQLSSELLPDG